MGLESSGSVFGNSGSVFTFGSTDHVLVRVVWVNEANLGAIIITHFLTSSIVLASPEIQELSLNFGFYGKCP